MPTCTCGHSDTEHLGKTGWCAGHIEIVSKRERCACRAFAEDASCVCGHARSVHQGARTTEPLGCNHVDKTYRELQNVSVYCTCQKYQLTRGLRDIVEAGARRADMRRAVTETDQERLARQRPQVARERQQQRPVLTPMREDPPAPPTPPQPVKVAVAPEPQKDEPVDDNEDQVLASASKRFSLLELD